MRNGSATGSLSSRVGSGNLKARYDTIILPSQSLSALLHGYKEGEPSSRRSSPSGESSWLQRPEHTGGIGLQGAVALQTFVREGGTLVTFDDAAQLPIELFGLPLRNTITTGSGENTTSFYSPGSILRINVDNKHPIGFGMPQSALAFVSGGEAWELTLDPAYNKGAQEVKTVARYASQDLLASGWLTGERQVAGKVIVADARHGEGRIVLFGFRPQFRGQTFGTFKLLLNTIYLASADPLSGPERPVASAGIIAK